MMQKTDGDEGADWAERFEMNFYQLIEDIKNWTKTFDQDNLTLEMLEQQPIIQKIMNELPAPLQLNFQNELELIAENEEQVRFD
ncbi:hypothetical protein [Bacillus sp. Marseille-P3661]|uniref:hypothetical protein n=1 Tax=Bacillus sp. Marseille-P3661 TaxID=1936234 RepID=UPI000C81D208|nr:hypothetical protein [Bacillus sp. Marseille-P3661]